MEGCLEDAPLLFPSAAARELGAHAAFRAAEADVTAAAPAAWRALELASSASGASSATARRPRRPRRSRRSAGATRRSAAPSRSPTGRPCRAAARRRAPPPTLTWTALPLPPAPGPPPPPPPPGRDMDDADWRLYDEVLVRSATVSDLPDDGPLRRLEAADDGGDGAARAAVRDRRFVARCVVALRRAAARGAWEASDDPADVSDLLRYAYAEFRDVAGLDAPGAAEAVAGATRAGAGQLREARAFARELRFFDCARAWDAATRGLRGERSAWLLGGGDGDPRDGGDGDPTRLDLRALKSGPLVDGLARLARLLEADGAAGASWDGADDDDDDDGAGTPPLRRLQRLRVARRVVSTSAARSRPSATRTRLAGAGAAAAGRLLRRDERRRRAPRRRRAVRARRAPPRGRARRRRAPLQVLNAALAGGALRAQFAAEREARRLLAPALHAACAAICGGTPPAGAALADAARALRGARRGAAPRT
ncbi:hypothetical protein JL722_3684 [Aureococcus anophagefferens]|nr:hypothetical protein JL722_3684 [Aureococcus anophagefferens]